mgnify:CR=1 FL=1
MPYLGNTAGNRFVASKAATQHSGDGSTTVFPLDHAVGSDEDILVSVDGVIQEPSVAYAVSNGTTLTFTAAPSSNSGNNIFVYYLFRTVATADHPSTSALSATSGTFSAGVTATTGTFSGAVSAASVDADGGVTVDNITIDGTEIDLSSGNLTIDVAGQLVINSDSGQVVLQDDTVNWGNLQNSSGDFVIEALGTDKDMIFKGLDGSSVITALTFDMSDAGKATFNDSIVMGTAGNGIYLGVTSATSSNLLDDYEEGTWTPTWSSGFTSISYGLQRASYTKVGNVVSVQADIKFTGTSAGAALYLSGLPFTSGSTGNGFAAGSGTISYTTISTYANNANPTLYVQQGNTYIYFYTTAGATVSSNSNASNDWLQFTAIYQTNS